MKKLNFKSERVFKKAFRKKLKKSKKSSIAAVVGMSIVLPVHQVTGVLAFPKDKTGRKDRALEIVAGCTGNTWVTIDVAVLAAVTLAITNYGNAVSSDRPGLFTIMKNAINEKLLAPFQAAANANPVESRRILESGGFKVKEVAIPQIKEFKCENGTASGTVDLVTAGGPRNKAHLHQWYSSIDGVNFTREQATNGIHTTISNLPAGKYAYFTTELSVQDVLQGMSQVIRIMVK